MENLKKAANVTKEIQLLHRC